MKYIIITKAQPPFLTDWFDSENHFNPDPQIGMMVINLHSKAYTTDGITWQPINEDHL